MRANRLAFVALAIVALGSLSSAWTFSQAQGRYRNDRSGWGYRANAMVPAGTPIDVRLDSELSTEESSGRTWTGTVVSPIVSNDDRVLIPSGSQVTGIVTSSVQGTHNSPAQMSLTLRRVNVNGRMYSINADTEPIVAGSHRAKKIGAIVGGAAAGALLGHAVAKDHHGTLIGGLLGGATGYGLTRHAMRTLVLKDGTVLTFTMREGLVARRY